MTNIYHAFLDLLPARPLQVATVLSVGDGMARVELPGGGLMQVRGQTSVGQRVFVRDGVIEGDAPDLPVVLIEI